MPAEKWIGLAEVRPMAECTELDYPAFVNVIAVADDRESFIDLVRLRCGAINLQLLRLDDIETWRERIAQWQPEDEILSLAASVGEDNPFAFGTFVCFDE